MCRLLKRHLNEASPLYSQNNVYKESKKFSNFCGIYNLLESSAGGLEENFPLETSTCRSILDALYFQRPWAKSGGFPVLRLDSRLSAVLFPSRLVACLKGADTEIVR